MEDAAGMELIDLIFHEGDERGDDDCHPIAQQCWELITQGLATASRQDRYGRAASQHRFDHLTLTGTKAVEAKMAVQSGRKCVLRLGAEWNIIHTYCGVHGPWKS